LKLSIHKYTEDSGLNEIKPA